MKGRRFSGWGGTNHSEQSHIIAPANRQSLAQIISDNPQLSVLARGLGRSYGDSALISNGLLVDCRFLDRMLAFDQNSGTLQCEAGLSIFEINRILAPTGWMLPVTPGTQYVTVGGAIANDVHGKNHLQQGSFGLHVQALQLLRSDGETLSCTAQGNPELFAATIGGLGLTGVILNATIQLRAIRSQRMHISRKPFRDIDTLFVTADIQKDDWEYRMAWFDPASGCRSGTLIAANHIDEDGELEWPSRRTLTLRPLSGLPTGLAGRMLMKAGNSWYRRGLRSDLQTTSVRSVLYPLDQLPGWNALFGKPGLYQHQCLLPAVVARQALDELLNQLADADQAPTLAVGKWFGDRTSAGLISFPAPGFSLALDFANRGRQTRHLLDQLDLVVARHSGRIYPAKDARMSAALFCNSYPGLEKFSTLLDPRFESDFWRRMEQSA